MSNEVEDSNPSSRSMFGQTKVNQKTYEITKLNGDRFTGRADWIAAKFGAPWAVQSAGNGTNRWTAQQRDQRVGGTEGREMVRSFQELFIESNKLVNMNTKNFLKTKQIEEINIFWN